ncbi:ABC transporter ATP-binding protein [Nesterenkonia suensis]
MSGSVDLGASTALELADVSAGFGGRDGRVAVLEGVSLRVEAGTVTWLSGPSGSGKSTLLRIAGGLSSPGAGAVRIAGVDPYRGRAAYRVRREQVGIVFQAANLLPDFTVEENLAVAAADEHRGRIPELLETFGLTGIRRRRATEVSGGEAQRTAFARALVNRPTLLLADEPTAGLDADRVDVVLDVIRGARDQGCAVVVASHDDAVSAVADRTVTIREGRCA